MRSGLLTVDAFVMDDAGRVRIRLELQPGAEPIRGLISADGVPERGFVGWLGLADALQQIMSRTADDQRM